MANETTQGGALPQDVHNDLLRYGIDVGVGALDGTEQAHPLEGNNLPEEAVAYG